jgi:hypothetical protein
MKNRCSIVRQALSVFCIVLLIAFSFGRPLAAQQTVASPPLAAQQPAPPPQLLSPQQLDTLVAPIALYPDALLSQILVASTYPLELVEAEQWLQQNQNLQGQQLVDAARQQNWDASIQALVVAPDVLARLNSDIRWTTDLGNAFLAQQADVMNAIQRMRARAQAAGQLTSNTQETIATDTQGGQTAIEIQPTNPDVMYVPEYNPVDVWGPPEYGYYPPLYYPDFGWGFGFGPGIYLGGFFGGLGWGGWGWGPNWFGCSIWENGFFFNHYGFHGYGFGGRGFGGRGFGGAGYGGRGTWAHNPEHRMGVPYSSQAVANRFGGNFGGRGRFAGAGNTASIGRMNGAQTGNFGNRGNIGGGAARGAGQFSGSRFGSSGVQQNYRGGSGFGGTNAYRSTPSYGNSFRSSGNSFRSSGNSFRSGGNFGGVRSMPAYRSTPSFGGTRSGGNSFRSAPSFGGSARGGGMSRSFGGGGSFHGGGGGFHGGGGGGFHGGGGGGFHGGGGGGFHGGGGGSHGGGGRR